MGGDLKEKEPDVMSWGAPGLEITLREKLGILLNQIPSGKARETFSACFGLAVEIAKEEALAALKKEQSSQSEK